MGNALQRRQQVVTADRVIVAAGCVGTNEIMLRSKTRGTLPNLSDRVGYGFSTNGDYLAFLDKTRERISLTRGPVTTSFAHFNTPASGGDRFVMPFERERLPPALRVPHPRCLVPTAGHNAPAVR